MKTFVLSGNTGKRKNTYQIAYKELLNDAQYDAVMHHFGYGLVIAGAGTGKTRTLVYRVARLVEDSVKPEHILLLTFTRRAAAEMLDRSAALLDERCKNVRGGTFHHYCNQLLHRFADVIGYPETFTLLDQQDSQDALQFLRSPFVKKNKLKRFPQKQTLQSIISTSVNRQITMYEALARDYPQFLDQHDHIHELALSYATFKEEQGVMDFDDLLLRTKELLQKEEVRRIIAKENHFVMVDEYQDTNALQAEIAFLASSYHKNLMAVGDDAQSIYAFRGADYRNIFQFPKKAEPCRVITLEKNYRSTMEILGLTNHLMKTAQEKYDKTLYSDKTQGDLPGLVKAPDERDQSRFVAQMILQLREQEIPLGEMAVLFRNGRDSYDLEWELNAMSIPFRKYGGLKFEESAHIKDLIAHLKVVINPEDQMAWSRILQLLDGLGPKTADELIFWLKSNKEKSLQEYITTSNTFKKGIKTLGELLSSIKEHYFNPKEAIRLLAEYYRPMCEKKFDDFPKRWKDLEAFILLCTSFSNLDEMVQQLILDPI
ncbi:ATP-dependent helicase, partial [Balneolaceae bacterium ANBcel3]|nr:ATP-dependent helicase [Balneolaceae bacterium ANBcel3]